MKTGTFVVAAMTLALAAGGVSAQSDIAREGSGQHRAACNKLELTAVPADFWSTLTDWTNGSALTAESTKGKVVLIGTWWSAYKPSHKAVETLQKLSDKYGKDGLIVIGVHHDSGWDGAKKVLDDQKATFLVAHDKGNALRTAVNSDQDPDFYVIDRAGNFRYVDIQTPSVANAVQAAVNESVEDAKAAPSKVASAAMKAADLAERTQTLSGDLKPGQILNVPFTFPEASAFTDASWPEQNQNVQYAKSVQGSKLPVEFTVEKWITAKPNTNGRVMVLDFWATWCGPCKRAMPTLDQLYLDNKKDLAIIGVSDEPESTVSPFLSSHKHAYFQAFDTKQNVYKSLEITAIPHCVIISSDGVVRWQGNPLQPEFVKTVKAVIAADPGVAARRKAEGDYMKSKGG